MKRKSDEGPCRKTPRISDTYIAMIDEIIARLPTVILGIVDTYASVPGSRIRAFMVDEFADAIGMAHVNDVLLVTLRSGDIYLVDAQHKRIQFYDAFLPSADNRFDGFGRELPICQVDACCKRFLIEVGHDALQIFDVKEHSRTTVTVQDPGVHHGFCEFGAVGFMEEGRLVLWSLDLDTLALTRCDTTDGSCQRILDSVEEDDDDLAHHSPHYSDMIAWEDQREIHSDMIAWEDQREILFFIHTDKISYAAFEASFGERYELIGRKPREESDDQEYSLFIRFHVDSRRIVSRQAFQWTVHPLCIQNKNLYVRMIDARDAASVLTVIHLDKLDQYNPIRCFSWADRVVGVSKQTLAILSLPCGALEEVVGYGDMETHDT